MMPDTPTVSVPSPFQSPFSTHSLGNGGPAAEEICRGRFGSTQYDQARCFAVAFAVALAPPAPANKQQISVPTITRLRDPITPPSAARTGTILLPMPWCGQPGGGTRSLAKAGH